jgi:hypothetical protein
MFINYSPLPASLNGAVVKPTEYCDKGSGFDSQVMHDFFFLKRLGTVLLVIAGSS